ncbi:MAG: YggT family protein [Thiofilum sp.]|uniref:YggT family protein n=1 Tax=Thiofilum sp. TaxID=2212733 RepID=UPI0025E61C41|nr:YggT family protein [Thiofilum sp.]MBK8452294.1 YggT family protein [Thiofilum sp.]
MVLQQILVFLVSTLFSFYIGAVLIRFLLAWSRADFYNPFSQFIVKITNPPLVKLRRIIPALGKLDTAAIVLALLLQIALIILLVIIQGKSSQISANIFYIVLLAMIELIRTVIWIYIIALIIQAILSWTNNQQGNPIAGLLDSLTRPLLRPVQRYVQPISGIDVSPMIVMLGLYIILIILGPSPF